ncbi:nonribosomal peptide synthase Pes1 [Colletotrichum scovillei]|uniref:Nonribosomal peptide synthase Pes1 n=1 Tax=Colletotrichum scovillei TaxID=1209932 RepID=A0A9P7QUN2_9PEZI|nr:nonribosomal peptide synthase Pes1 [Colletotrichum scovillei]KAG7040536.1 nonribosomal peptide synthase Pes1 [Colletotrichum scovillei]KAG7060585.1 nonribosomal peptide synthase Pes1 [Colletotrichum scovillei]
MFATYSHAFWNRLTRTLRRRKISRTMIQVLEGLKSHTALPGSLLMHESVVCWDERKRWNELNLIALVATTPAKIGQNGCLEDVGHSDGDAD